MISPRHNPIRTQSIGDLIGFLSTKCINDTRLILMIVFYECHHIFYHGILGVGFGFYHVRQIGPVGRGTEEEVVAIESQYIAAVLAYSIGGCGGDCKDGDGWEVMF
jgi:hypothetical protein